MTITEVLSEVDARNFLMVNVLMNKGNPKYIRPIDNEVNDVFDTQKNKAFKFGMAKRWLLKDEKGNLIGRIAAFVSSKYFNYGDTFPVGCCGFFDCINDQAAANKLFDTAKDWLKQQNVQAMDGPVNFGERDKWWGLMVEGFDEEPMYGISYNPTYYEALFENYGFRNYYNQFYYRTLNKAESLSEKYKERYLKFASKPGYVASHIDKSRLPKFARDFSIIYNQAWAQHKEGKEISYEAALKIFKKMAPVMDESLVWFAYYKDEPIGMWVNIPDLNQYFKYFNGRFGLLQKLALLLIKKIKPSRKINGVAFGIVPKFQGHGIDAFMIYSGAQLMLKQARYDLIEMGWAGDWNPKMIGIYKSCGGVQSRRMVTFRYLFDQNIPFQRHPVVEA